MSSPLQPASQIQVDQLLHSHLGHWKSKALLASVELESLKRNQSCADLSRNLSSAEIYTLCGFW